MEKQNSISKIKKILEKQKYAIVGNHSGVQVCRWTKNSLNKKGVCWKEKFYGIKSHRCCQMSPAVMWCENSCLHCWRPIELNLGCKISQEEIDEPEEILKGVIEARRELMIGYKGNKKVSDKIFYESLNPTLFTFSLSGEPTIYPKLAGLIKEVRKLKAVSFLVTNGLNPEKILELKKENALPTQLTVSCNTSNERLFKIWHRSRKEDAWKKFNQTLELIKKLKGKTRRCFRMTLVKKGKEGKFSYLNNMEDEHVIEYANLIRKSEPDFIHVKGFKSLGFSRQRLGYDKQPLDYEVKKFAEKLAKELKKDSYKILAEEPRSCVVLLGKSKRGMKINMKKV